MSLKHSRPAFPALAAAGTLLLLGCTLALPTARSTVQSADTTLLDQASEAGLSEKPRRQARRVRASLSLPYFSFARPLNSRS